LLERLRTFSELALSSAEAKGAPGAGLAALIHKLQVRAWSCARRRRGRACAWTLKGEAAQGCVCL